MPDIPRTVMEAALRGQTAALERQADFAYDTLATGYALIEQSETLLRESRRHLLRAERTLRR